MPSIEGSKKCSDARRVMPTPPLHALPPLLTLLTPLRLSFVFLFFFFPNESRNSYYCSCVGGFFDHVSPPQVGVPNPDGLLSQGGFNYTRLGIRIPTIAISYGTVPRHFVDSRTMWGATAAAFPRRVPAAPPLPPSPPSV